VEITGGTFYNLAFPGNQIAMPPLLFEGGIEYADGTPATVEQMAEDVVTFLAWAGEPTLEARKRLGVKVMLFLIVFTALLYAVKREVWKDVH
jgi:ubiquinol-cytochrome c reductase cytochrome c1 subunit